ncbi:MAG TPA: TraR/DksA C4-type zinc finger protein [Micromonosporaceae bacterium]|jgi:RNA polymerase-binding transcription factor DksA
MTAWPGTAQRLVRERDDTAEQIANLSSLVGEIIAASTDVATDDEHDPEGQTIAFERAQAIALLEQARTRLADIDSALDRLRSGSYGICERCGGPIATERLEARPAARTCIVCASARA